MTASGGIRQRSVGDIRDIRPARWSTYRQALSPPRLRRSGHRFGDASIVPIASVGAIASPRRDRQLGRLADESYGDGAISRSRTDDAETKSS